MWAGLSHATQKQVDSDEICSLRPDLCDDSVKAKPRPRPKIRANAQAKKCRIPGHAYSLDQSDLPLCSNLAVNSAPAENQIAKRQPANSREPSLVDFNSYLSANASNPALSRHLDSQKAFQEPVRKVTYGFEPAEGASVKETPSATPSPATSTPTPTPTSGSTTSEPSGNH